MGFEEGGEPGELLLRLVFTQPVVRPNRKCCINRNVESGALKMSANVTLPTLLNSALGLKRFFVILPCRLHVSTL